MEKEKKYLIDNPTLMAEWNWEKNNELGLDPKTLTCGSGKKVWWKCDKGHEWVASIGHRNNGRGCPYCSNQKVLKGYNDLQTINPNLAAEWNYEKNGDLRPEDFMPNSNKKVWWLCQYGHEWESIIANRSKGNGCPYCSGRNVVKGRNDLATINSALVKEWDYEKNGNLKPEDITASSHKKVWWICNKGHKWQATISDRNNGRGCPVCNSERHTSLPEFAIIYYLRQYGLEVVQSYKKLGYELDVYIPTKKIAIEYDGYFWHKEKTKNDLDKNLKCKNDGITLYRIREGLPILNDSSIDFIVDKNKKNLGEVLQKILNEIVGFSVDVDLKRDNIEIENLREYTEKDNSLLFTNPELAKEWNYGKNGDLRPEYFLPSSNKKVWWKCAKGHEWQTTINSRSSGNGCPYCSGRSAIEGENDLLTVNPTLAKEWNYGKNGDLRPEYFLPSSNKKVWWKCAKGHEWQATISARNCGCGCPICASKKVLKGFNDLATLNPELAKEWNYEKNGNLTPQDVTVNSNIKVWWKCNKGHEWQTIVANRNKGKGCPYCSGRFATKGKNDLSTINPILANEWNYEKNDNLKPEDFTANSSIKVWWRCKNGHEWLATINSRSRGNGCPYCANKKILKNYNDLATINPELAKEWNYEKNGGLRPEDVAANSHKIVWWKCSKGHEWQAMIKSRNRGNGCPYCSGRKK